ncbi:hypothetical protein ACH4FX_38125 [Streptomyces sp. NPDC018019]|uniref:hypothetical protein n=1 Tax=Streptomyces sp. NPDC018019 TaxID=3365030 RepID=UPI0037B80586
MNSENSEKMQSALSEVKQAKRDRNRAANAANSTVYREDIRRLARAIDQHRAARLETREDADQHDREPWQVLEDLTVPNGPGEPPKPLRVLLDEICPLRRSPRRPCRRRP